jgi:hypothetical protein
MWLCPRQRRILLKGTVSQDFQPSIFFRQSIPHRPPIITLKYFLILFRIRRSGPKLGSPWYFKGILSRDFRPLVFFTNQPHLGP